MGPSVLRTLSLVGNNEDILSNCKNFAWPQSLETYRFFNCHLLQLLHPLLTHGAFFLNSKVHRASELWSIVILILYVHNDWKRIVSLCLGNGVVGIGCKLRQKTRV